MQAFSELPIPKYYQVYLSIKEKIDSGEYAVDSPIPSERQLTEMFSVSRITIVKALDLLAQEGLIDRRQGLGNYVNGHQPEASSRPLSLAFVVPGNLTGYISTVLSGVIEESMQSSVQVQVLGPRLGPKNPMRFDENCCLEADGVIIYPAEYGWHDWIERLLDKKKAVVLIDRYFNDLDCDRVVYDDEAAGYEVTRLLIKRGFKRIAFLTQNEINTTSVIGRLKGYRRAHQEAGLPLLEELMWVDVYNRLAAGIQLMMDDFSVNLERRIRRDRPDAVFCINHRVMEKFIFDVTSLQNRHFLSALQGGEDESKLFSIAQGGICDHEIEFRNPVYLCAAMQSGRELGRQAFEVLWKRLKGQQPVDKTIKRVVPMQIVELSEAS